MSLVALDHVTHASLTFASVEEYSFAAATNLVPLLAFEVVAAAQCFPIIFPAKDAPIPHALLGLGKRNEFVAADGRWTAPYLPLTLANHPFSLYAPPLQEEQGTPAAKAGAAAKKAKGETEDPVTAAPLRLALVIEDSAPHFQQPDGAPMYDATGQPTEMTQRIATVLQAQYQRHQKFVPNLSALHASGILKERTLTLTRGGNVRTVAGLRVADREAVMALPDATLATWSRNGLLELLHAHWKSMDHIPALLDLLDKPDTDSVRQ